MWQNACTCCFLHLIGLFSVTWLFLVYKFTWFIIHFMFLSDEGPRLETYFYIAFYIGSIPTFYISICILTLPIHSTLRLYHLKMYSLVVISYFCFKILDQYTNVWMILNGKLQLGVKNKYRLVTETEVTKLVIYRGAKSRGE